MAEPHHHPTPKQYWGIAAILAVLTAIEVALYYVEQGVEQITSSITSPTLIVLSFLKFLLVISYFMHLRYEKGTVKRFFSGGFVLALGLYGVVLAALGIAAVL